MTGWTWAAASCRGTSHDKTGTRLQDAFACCSPSSGIPVVAMASDGVGTAEFGGQGASLVCRSLMIRARQHFLNTLNLPSDEEITTWYATRLPSAFYSYVHEPPYRFESGGKCDLLVRSGERHVAHEFRIFIGP